METPKFSIDLVLKDGCNEELASKEFSKALELPKIIFQDSTDFITLRYSDIEKNIALEHCNKLNQQVLKYGYSNIEFILKEIY